MVISHSCFVEALSTVNNHRDRSCHRHRLVLWTSSNIFCDESFDIIAPTKTWFRRDVKTEKNQQTQKWWFNKPQLLFLVEVKLCEWFQTATIIHNENLFKFVILAVDASIIVAIRLNVMNERIEWKMIFRFFPSLKFSFNLLLPLVNECLFRLCPPDKVFIISYWMHDA